MNNSIIMWLQASQDTGVYGSVAFQASQDTGVYGSVAFHCIHLVTRSK